MQEVGTMRSGFCVIDKPVEFHIEEAARAERRTRKSLVERIEGSYESALPGLKYDPKSIEEHDLLLECLINASVAYIKDRPKGEKGEDIVMGYFSYKNMVFDISARARPYCPYHFTIGTKNINNQRIYPHNEIVEPLLLLAEVLGEKYEFIYNRVGNTADTFHYQALTRGCLKIFNTDAALWPAFVIELRGANPFSLAGEISREMMRFVDEGTESDVVVRSEGEKRYRAMVIPRHESRQRPGGIFADPDEFGLFGAAEMAGCLLCARTDRAFSQMISAEGGSHYEMALRELSYKPYVAKSLKKAS